MSSHQIHNLQDTELFTFVKSHPFLSILLNALHLSSTPPKLGPLSSIFVTRRRLSPTFVHFRQPSSTLTSLATFPQIRPRSFAYTARPLSSTLVIYRRLSCALANSRPPSSAVVHSTSRQLSSTDRRALIDFRYLSVASATV